MMKTPKEIAEIYNQFADMYFKCPLEQHAQVAVMLTDIYLRQEQPEIAVNNLVPGTEDLTSLHGGGVWKTTDKFVFEGVEYKVWVDHRGPYRDEFFFFNEHRSQSPLYACDPIYLRINVGQAWNAFIRGQTVDFQINKWNTDI